MGRRTLFDSWRYFDNPTRWRTFAPTDYPDILEQWRREHDFRTRSTLAHVPESTPGVMGWLYDDMRGHALLRATVVGLATLADRLKRGKRPAEPLHLSDKALRDPYSGQPLKWRYSQNGDELVVWSVGEDLLDDLGSKDWAPKAPVDVVVRMSLLPLKGAPAKDRKKTRSSKRRKKG